MTTSPFIICTLALSWPRSLCEHFSMSYVLWIVDLLETHTLLGLDRFEYVMVSKLVSVGC